MGRKVGEARTLDKKRNMSKARPGYKGPARSAQGKRANKSPYEPRGSGATGMNKRRGKRKA